MKEEQTNDILVSNGGEHHDREIVSFDKSMDVVIATAEKQVETLKKVLAIATKRTTHYDWVDQQGRPYLTSSGAEKLMPLFGVNLTDTQYKKTFSDDDKGQSYIYHYQGRFTWQGGSIEAIGACSSRDKFFAWDGKEKTYKPLSEVDETNIMKAAYSNMLVNGVTRLLGIRGLTWEELQGFGVDKSKVATVNYGGKQATPEETKAQNDIARWCLEMGYNDKTKALAILKTLTAFKTREGKEVEGVSSNRRLTGKRLEYAYQNIKKEYELWKKQQEDGEK